jgi:hypothetical protein
MQQLDPAMNAAAAVEASIAGERVDDEIDAALLERRSRSLTRFQIDIRGSNTSKEYGFSSLGSAKGRYDNEHHDRRDRKRNNPAFSQDRLLLWIFQVRPRDRFRGVCISARFHPREHFVVTRA